MSERKRENIKWLAGFCKTWELVESHAPDFNYNDNDISLEWLSDIYDDFIEKNDYPSMSADELMYELMEVE